MSQEDKLKELEALKEAGALTDEEFAAAKAKLETEAAEEKKPAGPQIPGLGNIPIPAPTSFDWVTLTANNPASYFLAATPLGKLFYGIEPLKKFADSKAPGKPGKAKRLATTLGLYAATIPLCLLLVAIMPAPPSGGGGGGGSGESVADCQSDCRPDCVMANLNSSSTMIDLCIMACEEDCN
jgi:hypothetical protein